MARLAGKTIVIIGAMADGAGPLAQRLAMLGAQIIAIGPLEAPLLRVARLYPEKIEVLAMDLHDLVACRRLARLWGGAPVHGLINLMPFAAPIGPAQLALESAVTILRPALVAGQGAVVCVAPAPAAARPTDTPAPTAANGARRRLAAVLFAAHQHHMALLAQARAPQGITVALVAMAPGLALAASAPLLAVLCAAPRPSLAGACFPLQRGAQSD